MIGLCLAVYGLWNFYVYSKLGIKTDPKSRLEQATMTVHYDPRPSTLDLTQLTDSFESKIIQSLLPVRPRKRNDAAIPSQAKNHLSYPQDQIPFLHFLTFHLDKHSQTQFNWKLLWIQFYFIWDCYIRSRLKNSDFSI